MNSVVDTTALVVVVGLGVAGSGLLLLRNNPAWLRVVLGMALMVVGILVATYGYLIAVSD